MATIMAELTDGVVAQGETDFYIGAVPFDPWCCADPWRRVTIEGTLGTPPEIASFFLSPNVVMRWEGATDLVMAASFVWAGGDVEVVNIGGAWIDPTDGSSDWGVPFGALSAPEGGNSPRANPGDPYRMTLDWNASGGDPTPIATFYVNGTLSASFYVTGVDDAFLAYGYATVPDPVAVGFGCSAWGGGGVSGPLYDIASLEVTCLPAPSSFPSLTAAWQDLP